MSVRMPRNMSKVFTAVALLLAFSFATTHAGSSPQGSQSTRQSAPAYAPEVVTITAAKTDTLVNDVNSNTLVDPGDTLEYNIVVSNSGDEDALATTFTDITDDTEVTVVGGSLRATPIGRHDSYNVIGNTHITHPVGTGLLANDIDPDGGALTASCAPCTTAQGAAVTLNPDGSFTYPPPASFTGTDTFTYTVTDPHGLTDTGTVTFTITNRIWWVDSDAPGGGDGTSTTPFNALSGAQAASAVNDVIFVYDRGSNYTGGLTMQDGQRLCGHGSDLQTCSGMTPPTGTTFPAAATNPTMTNAAGAGITLAANNTIYGITVGSTTSFGITGTNFGTLTAQNVTINTGNGGLSLTTGTANATFNAITAGGGVNNINLSSVAGTLDLGSGALSSSSSHALNVNAGTATIDYAGTINNSTADAVLIQNKTSGSVTLSGAVTATGTGITLLNNTGATLNFTGGLTMNTGTNEAFTATGGGTLNVTGTTNTVTTTTGTAVNIRNMTIGASGVTFRSVSANGSTNGIYLENNTGGAFTVAGTGSAGTGGTIQNTTGDGISLTNVNDVTLHWMTLNTTGRHGVFGTGVNNFTMNNSSVLNAGNADEEDAFSFSTPGAANVTGILTLNNVLVQGFLERGLYLENNAGTLTLNINNGTRFENNHDTFGTTALRVVSSGTANIQLNVDNTTFDDIEGPSIQFVGGSSGTNDVNLTNNTTTDGGGPDNFPSGGGFDVISQNGATVTFDIIGNTLTDTIEGIVIASAGSSGGNVSGTISGNTVSMDAAAGFGDGARIALDGFTGPPGDLLTWTILIQNNTFDLNSVGDDGIQVLNRDHRGVLNLTIENNTIRETVSEAFRYFSDEDLGLGAPNPGGLIRFVNNDLINIDVDNNENEIHLGTSDTANSCYHISGNDNGAGGSPGVINFSIVAPSVGQITQASTAALAAANAGATIAGSTPTFNGTCTNPPLPSTITFGPAAEQTIGTTAVNPALPFFTSDTAPKSENNPKLAAGKGPKALTNGLTPEALTEAFTKALASEAPEATTTVGPFTLPPGESTTITFQVVVNTSFPPANNPLCNQATISGSNFGDVLTDDPDTGTPNDPTCTTVEIAADLAITKTDGQTTAVPGQLVTYTIVASNAGPSPDAMAMVTDTFPAILSGVTWTCVGAGGAACTAAGSGNINETVNLPAGGSVTFTASGLIDAGATGTLVNTAVVAVSAGVTDPTPANNSATDTDTLTPTADLSITKTDGLTVANPGESTTYTITVSNVGPSTAVNATVTDTFPAALTGVTWTCAGTGGATCTAAGAGDIADTVTLPPGSSLTYIINATIDAAATGTLANTATVTAPGGVTDPDTGNNSATDTTSLDAPPVITDLTVTPGTINENDTVGLSLTFTDPNTPETHEVVITWGDGMTDTINLPIGALTITTTHQYLDDDPTGTSSDVVTVTVTVNEPDGGTDSDTAVITVNNVAPSLSGISATSVNENGTTTLTGSLSDVGTQDTFTLLVNWGDGNSDTYTYTAGTTSFSETHPYLDDDPSGTPADDVTINLTLTDDDTGSDATTTTATISNVAPTLANVAVTPSINEGSSATLTGDINDPGTQDTFTLAITWGDGLTSTFTYPAGTTNFSETHVYADDDPTGTPADDYAINLTVTDDDTGSDTAVVTVTVNNTAPDLFNLAATPPVISETNTLTFTGNITDLGMPDTFTLTVDWADGHVEMFNYPAGTTAFTLTHVYQDDALAAWRLWLADFTINATLTDDDTGSDSGSVIVTVNNVPPTLSNVAISSPVNEGDTAILSGTISDPSPADSFTLLVDWGDGITETFSYGAGTTTFSEGHVYTDDNPTGTPSDSYTVGLTLTDDNNGSHSGSTAVTVNNIAPTLSGIGATAVAENGTTTLSGSISDPGAADTFTLVVNWGDGITDTFNYPAGAASFSETHQYLDDDPSGTPADDVTISLTLTDDDTGSDAATTLVTITNVAPTLSNLTTTAVDENGLALLSGDIGDPGTLDTFTMVVDWGDGITETFSYGAGTTSFGETHLYLDDDPSGTPSDDVVVTITITDDDTGSSSDTAVQTILNVPPNLFNVVATPLIILENNAITVTGQISDPGTLDTFTLLIDWADGITDTFNYPAGTTSFLATHTYQDDGRRAPLTDFDIVLTLTDDDTGSDTETTTVQVDNVPPTLNNITLTTPINENDSATLAGSIMEISPADTFTLTVAWGDGNVDSYSYGAGTSSFSETHQYLDDDPSGTAADVYTVTLTLQDDNNGSDVAVTSLMVHNIAPTVDAGPDQIGAASTALGFTGVLTDPGTLDTHTILWDFGDGITTTGSLTATHTFGAPGVYTVTLTVMDDDTGVGVDYLVVTVEQRTIYLPIIMFNSGAVAAPDLVVSSLTATANNVVVTVTNLGSTAVTDAFWVDVYIDPDPVPTMVNQTWPFVADEGMVWGVSGITLNPGQTLTLTLNDGYYRADLSAFSGGLATGTPVYAQVDSAHTNTNYGSVLENHEISGGAYNNISGTMVQ